MLNFKLTFVLQAPRTSHCKTDFFSSPQGKLLSQFCCNVGIVPELCDVIWVCEDPILDEKMFKKRFYSGTKKIIELAVRHELIRRKAVLSEANLIVPLDNESCKAFDVGTIGDWRGSVVYSPLLEIKIMPCLLPTQQNWDFRPVILKDLEKAKREASTPEHSPMRRDVLIPSKLGQVISYFKELKKHEMFAFDIENKAHELSCISFCYDPKLSISIPFQTEEGRYWSGEQEKVIKELIAKALQDPNLKSVAQNAQHDCTFLKVYENIPVTNLYFDTMCGFHTLYPELPKGLGFLESIYTDQPYHKIKFSDYRLDTDFYWYNAIDSSVTREIAPKLLEEMDEVDKSEGRNVKEFYFGYVHKLLPPLMDLQIRGIRFDIEKQIEASQRLELETLLLQDELERFVGHDVNCNSPKQVTELLYDEYKFRPRYRKGRICVDIEKLSDIARENPDHPKTDCIKLILAVRQRIKLRSTYLKGKSSEDGRIRCAFQATGTTTGRLSSSRSIIFDSGTNLQNIPSGIARECFIPDDGYKFLEVDLCQAESRVVAYCARETKLIEIIESGRSIHLEIGKLMFGHEIQKGTKEYAIAKAMGHAGNYGAGPQVAAKLMGVPLRQAKYYIDLYLNTFPGIVRWHEAVQQELRDNNCVLYTPLGRRRQFYKHWGDDLFRAAYAFIGQGTIGDLLNKIVIELDATCQTKPRIDILLPVHDSVLVQVSEDMVAAGRGLLGAVFSDPKFTLKINNKEFMIPFEIKEGTNWDDME